MGTIADKLAHLNLTKTAIKDALLAKGVAIEDSDTFRSYAEKINEISVTEDWKPNPNWWDINKILDEDTRDYKGKVGVIMYDFDDVSNFELATSGMTAVATSDGAFYSYADNGAKVLHNWDVTQDKDDGRGLKTRWVIYYYTTDTTSDLFLQTNTKFGWAYNYIAYLVLRINCSNGYSFCSSQRLLEAIDNVGYVISGTDFYGFCTNCATLQKLPDVIDTSKAVNFNNFCAYCNTLLKLPDVLDTSKGTNFNYFCYSCYTLKKLPDILDVSNGTTFNSFCQNCYSLTKLPDILDTGKGKSFNSFCGGCTSLQKLPNILDISNGTNFGYFAYNCPSLIKTSEITMLANTTAITSKHAAPFANDTWLKTILLTLPSNNNFWLDMSTRITVESFRYVADHAPDVNATPRTLTIGSTNIARCNEADSTIITDLQAKGWTIA